MPEQTALPSLADILPPDVLAFLRTRITAEFATVSKAGHPIDTPSFAFPDQALTTIAIGTGVAYPAKAERARRNPRAGLLIEGEAGDPVIAMAGYAAVRDADIQANLERYLAETILAPNVDPARVPWDYTRKRLYYLARILVEVAPAIVRWWPNRAAMESAPNLWRAAPGTQFPPSDPAPNDKQSEAPRWRQPPWPELAQEAMASGMPAHLTLCDGDGFPVPIRVRDAARSDMGFRLTVPVGAPWHAGKASLSFVGKQIFLGQARREGNAVELQVERALPVLPMMDERGVLGPDVLARLDGRLAAEMARRGQPMPVVPEVPPAPSQGALLRAGEALAMRNDQVGGGIAR